MSTKTSKRHLNPELTQAINGYGREKLREALDLSKGMVDSVCAGYRRFGIETAKDVARELGIGKEIVRPDLWA